jgi:hypothetical protein
MGRTPAGCMMRARLEVFLLGVVAIFDALVQPNLRP